MDFSQAPRPFQNYLVSIHSPRSETEKRNNEPVKYTNASLLNYVKISDPKIEEMFKLEFDRAVGKDQEYH